MHVDTHKKVPGGWCSWYHYFTKIDEKEFLKNLHLSSRFKSTIEIFQLDDGYQPALGEWLKTNEKFPAGLKGIAEKVSSAGLIPGIWVAPFFVQKDIELVRDHPDWVLQDENGKKVVGLWNKNWGFFRYAYCLDISRSDVQEHLRKIFNTLYEWGFRFFKLDFLFGGSLPGNYHRKDLTSLQILRQVLKLIRKEVKDSFIMGSGCPLEAGIGIVDSMRVGNDVTPVWSNYIDQVIGKGFEQLSTKNCIRNTLTRSFMHNVLFQNDPDCLITRTVNNKLTEVEMFTLGQVNALSGGVLFISDDLESLDEKNERLREAVFELQKKINSTPRIFFSPDFMDKKMPEIQAAVGDNDAYIGVYNFNQAEKKQTVALENFISWKKYSVTDYSTGKTAEIKGNLLITSKIESHGSQLFYVRKG